ncbi:MAG: hypothetical protein ACT4OU_02570 [Hyphomicrobium sp.]
MRTPAYVLRLAGVGGLAALALGYGGALALDGIGMTPPRDRGAAPSVRRSEPPDAKAGAGPVQTGALDERLSTGPLGDADAALEAAEADPAVELDFERINIGGGLAKAAPLVLPPPQSARAGPNPLQNVELLEQTPKPGLPEQPPERIIEIGPKRSAASANAGPAAGDLTPDVSEQPTKPRKSAKAKKRKTDDSFAGSVQSFFGFD